eukprot:m.220387 g.220387  ORF g.220387 m.220387 type:complete len:84 (+) comp26302_c0_seq14:2020-2271(+)
MLLKVGLPSRTFLSMALLSTEDGPSSCTVFGIQASLQQLQLQQNHTIPSILEGSKYWFGHLGRDVCVQVVNGAPEFCEYGGVG